jgi:PadR family transcriptional regulator, regulatory protein AphA
MSTPSRSLSTTSFALLSHLAMKPWSAYELAVQRQRYFRYFWPRAQRGLYEELKRLADLGLAEAEIAHTGRRQRTVYSITDAGREALSEWLDEPLSPVALEFEAALRIFAAPVGTKAQLEKSLRRLRVEAREMTAFNDAIAQEYIEGRAPFQHEAHVRSLVVDFMTDFMSVLERWVDRTLEEVDSWEDLSAADKTEQGRDRLLAARRRRQLIAGDQVTGVLPAASRNSARPRGDTGSSS